MYPPSDERARLYIQLTTGLPKAARQWQRLADQQLAEFGITLACAMPLLVIGRAGGGIRQVELAQQLNLEGPSLVRLLDILANDGLLRREADPADRRANLLWLSDAGLALVSLLEQRLVRLRGEVFGDLSLEELHVVTRLWQRLADAADTPS